MSPNDAPHDDALDDSIAFLTAAGFETTEAAEACGRSKRTIQRRLQDPEVRQRISWLRALLVERAAGRVASVMARAVSTLDALMADVGESSKVRGMAAKTLLDFGLKAHRAGELEDRMREIERLLKEQESAVS